MKIPIIFAIFTTIALSWTASATQIATETATEIAAEIAGATVLRGSAIEGGMIFARTTPGSLVSVDETQLRPTAGGYFAVGFHRDSDKPVKITITTPDGTAHSSQLVPEQRSYAIQRIDGLAQKMVTPPQEVLDRIAADAAAVRAARAVMPPPLDAVATPDWLAGFDWPATGRISGVYGSQRILNGAPRQPHYGIDIAAPTGTPVRAPATGVITLVKDLYYSGWTVMMAHGAGINSGFLHLDQVDVAVGDRVERGAIIGTVGSTGRSTGPHLDWRIDWHGRRVDVGLLAPDMP